MKKVTKSIFLIALLVMMSAFSMTVFAEPGEGNDEVKLDFKMAGDQGFRFYISESDTETGELILSGDQWDKIYSGSVNLKPGKTYYLHAIYIVNNYNNFGYAGKFTLTGDGLMFNNNSNVLLTNKKDFKLSATGFGEYDPNLIVATNNYLESTVPLDGANWIYSSSHPKSINYVSTKIVPTQPKFTANASAINNSVSLTWNSISGATSYSVERSTTAGGPYTPVASDLTETSYTDKSVTANTTYYYIVKAKLSDTETVTSSEVSATPTNETPALDSKLKVVLEPTESLQLSVDDNLAINTNMIWTSSDNTVATVNEKGVVTALAPGNTVITVKSPDGTYTDYINVLVVEDASDYRLAIDLKVGQSARLTVDDLTNTVNATWEPMDSAIANVTSKGKVTALKKGLVLFTAEDEEGNVIGKVYVRVRE